MIDDGDRGAIGGMKTGRGDRRPRRKPASVPLFPPQIPHDQTRTQIRAAAVGSTAYPSDCTSLCPDQRKQAYWEEDKVYAAKFVVGKRQKPAEQLQFYTVCIGYLPKPPKGLGPEKD
jgi:hypothetical protein